MLPISFLGMYSVKPTWRNFIIKVLVRPYRIRKIASLPNMDRRSSGRLMLDGNYLLNGRMEVSDVWTLD